jgi:hypothetical protein
MTVVHVSCPEIEHELQSSEIDAKMDSEHLVLDFLVTLTWP